MSSTRQPKCCTDPAAMRLLALGRITTSRAWLDHFARPTRCRRRPWRGPEAFAAWGPLPVGAQNGPTAAILAAGALRLDTTLA